MSKGKVIIVVIILLGVVSCFMISRKNNRIDTEIIGMNNQINPTTEIKRLDNGLQTVKIDGDYGFDNFIDQGGATSDSGVIQFLTNNISKTMSNLNFSNDIFGCSTISVKADNGNSIFGRNFDWYNCNAMIVISETPGNYKSISTVNMDFITDGVGLSSFVMTDEIKTIASLYAPIDGMNEKGVCISVNYIEDSSKINQDTSNKDLTTTTAIRLILNKAADVNEAIELLEQYDMHGSMGYMIHFAIADSKGKSVVVEYINNEMKVLDTPVVTNFYMNEGEKNGIGTQQSHERYEILMNIIQEKQNKMSMEDVKAALESVCKKHYNDGETTEWSVIFNQSTGEINYYHREDYNNVYTFKLDMSNE
jgi:predicted choloylglycine hydrolase